MVYQIPSDFVGIGYYEGISLIIWIVAIIILIVASILFIYKSKHADIKSQKMLYIGYSLFLLFFALTRIFFIIGVYEADAFTGAYDFYTNLGYIMGIIGLISWLYIVETYMIKKTKRIFSIFAIIVFMISIIALLGPLSREFALQLIYILMPVAIGAITLLYGYIIVKTMGTIRKKALWLLIGLLIVIVGHFMDSQFFIEAFTGFPLEIAPSIMIVGEIIFLASQYIFE